MSLVAQNLTLEGRLAGLTARLEPGAVTAIVGPNGAGTGANDTSNGSGIIWNSPANIGAQDAVSLAWRLAGVREEPDMLHWNVRPACGAAR